VAGKYRNGKGLHIKDVAQQIYDLRLTFPKNPNKRELHMLTTAYAGLKYLITQGDSDMVRLQACNTLLGLPLMQARMKYMLEVEGLLLHHKQSADLSNKLSEILVGSDPDAIRALEHAESQIVPAKQKKTNENP
jgi:hypothetical protein